MKILITGGAGFIGSALVRFLIENTNNTVINVDALTYAGNLESLNSISDSDRYVFERVNICDKGELERVFSEYSPDRVMHLAAESHVDRSISGPYNFIETNIIGTFNLLEVSRSYWRSLSGVKKEVFRFHHISTDEVFGDLEANGFFKEDSPYCPSSPYSASKASSDHLVRAWGRTYGLPVIVTNCSNNYGPFQFPEKLIPVIIINALSGRKLPIYGDGSQERDWLFVDDHVESLALVLESGEIGETYNIGGHNVVKNIEVVKTICDELEKIRPSKQFLNIESYRELITFVDDRPGHDTRYAIDASKLNKELGWFPKETFLTGIRKTIDWYLNNQSWWENVLRENKSKA